MNLKRLSRRDFLRGGLAAGGAASIALAYAGDGQAQHGNPEGHATSHPGDATHAGSAAHMRGGAVQRQV